MGYSLDIIIPKSELEKIGFKEKTLFWNDKEYSLLPREFFIDNNILFIEITQGIVYDIMINNTKVNDPIVLTLYRKYNSVEKAIENNSITTLFKNIYTLDAVEIYLWEDDAAIDSKYKLIDTLDINSKMKEAIINCENIIIYR